MNDIHSQVGAYVTHALDEELRVAFAEHLPDCESCSREVREFNETLSRLSELSAAPPPASLRDDVLGAIKRVRVEPPDEPAVETPATPATAAPAPMPADDRRRSRRPRPWLYLAVAASLVLAVMFGGWAVLQQRRIDEIERAQASEQPVTELLRAADLRTYPLTWRDGSRGALLVSRQLGRVLITGSVPAADPGRTFQLWSIRGKEATPGPTFRAAAAGVWTVDLDGVQAIAITAEPEGGSEAPSRDLLASTRI
ncbi:anti-sigma factor domain-containing protein [Microlunatus sp. GCM10028923]|uniref:anti-sigma factor n=1 Tax=Microlunatus sp. GCM10028923 TaxID=3273400 RepID=UPI003607C655